MWDTLGWGGETQALIYDPKTKKVIGINALGVAPTGATPEFYRQKGMQYPPEFGPLAAVTPGTPGGLMVMLAEFGTLPRGRARARDPDGGRLPHRGAGRRRHRAAEGTRSSSGRTRRRFSCRTRARRAKRREPGEIFKQPDLAATLRKLVEAERQALDAGKNRKEAIHAAYDRFYRGDIAQEFVRGSREQGGLHHAGGSRRWKVQVEEPVHDRLQGHRGLQAERWTQGPAMLQALNILENRRPQGDGLQQRALHPHALSGDEPRVRRPRLLLRRPYVAPEEPCGACSRRSTRRRGAKQIDRAKNDAGVKPGDPYPFQGGTNPFADLLEQWGTPATAQRPQNRAGRPRTFDEGFTAGTTSIQAADEEGWVVSVTPSGGWIPAAIAGRTGIGMSQRMQSFVLDRAEGPFNVLEPGKRPRVTLTPTLALKDGQPYLCSRCRAATGRIRTCSSSSSTSSSSA